MVWSGMYGGPDSDRCEGTGGHPGVDITQATADEKIYSIGKGTVVLENNKIAKGWGKYVVIRHDNVSYHDCTDCPKSVYSIYTHLKSIDEALPPPGEIIGSNQVVGIMGATGITGGIHLHLQVQPAWNKKPYWPTYTNSIGKPMAYPLTNNCGRKKNQWCDLFLSEEQRQEAAENVRKNTISPIWFIENGSYRE
jgi:murein DD-endopeptidase MepM/ murein hydrolase activator NlpD